MFKKISLDKINLDSFEIKEIGSVREIRKGIARIYGLPSCINGQLVDFESGIKGMVLGFTKEEVMVLILGDETLIKNSEKVYAKVEPFKIPVGKNFIGRVVNSLAQPCDQKGPIEAAEYYPVFKEAPPIIDRKPVKEQLATGIKMIDSMISIAKGQRELIVGDRMTGKTVIGLDAILNQKGKDVICIYCCIGKGYAKLSSLVNLLQDRGAMQYTIVISAPASVSPNEQYLAPYTACALGEYFMCNGSDVLLVFDDLTRHAWIYRQLSLLLERSPGREAYPGDIFYLHSYLMERAGKFNDQKGGGSMTFLPIVETQQGDISGYIPSNLVSMTDGQIYMNADLFNEGFKPAIDLGLSVSRIGNKVQCPALREVTGMLRLEYVRYRELLRLTRLRTGLSTEAETQLKRGDTISKLLVQTKNKPIELEEQIILFYALSRNILELLSDEGLKKFMDKIYEYVLDTDADLVAKLTSSEGLTKQIKDRLDNMFVDFFKLERIL